MGCAAMTRSAVDYADVQGLVRFGYGKMKEASYALLRVKDAAAARAWLRTAPVTNAMAMNPPPSTAMQVAFTGDGLEALGVPDPVSRGFSPEFLAGMTEESRARRLGDVGSNAPRSGNGAMRPSVPHLVVMFFAEPGGLVSSCRASRDSMGEAFDEHALARDRGSRRRRAVRLRRWHQPAADRLGAATAIPDQPQFDYSNVVALGEFLLGYRNEYDKYTDRPLLDADAASATLLAGRGRAGEKGSRPQRNVSRDAAAGSRRAGVLAIHHASRRAETPPKRDKLGAAMVGRTRAGDPLVPIQRASHSRDRTGPGADSPESVHVRQGSGRARAARSARTCAARIRAIPTIPGARPDSRNSSPCWVSARRVSATI